MANINLLNTTSVYKKIFEGNINIPPQINPPIFESLFTNPINSGKVFVIKRVTFEAKSGYNPAVFIYFNGIKIFGQGAIGDFYQLDAIQTNASNQIYLLEEDFLKITFELQSTISIESGTLNYTIFYDEIS
jgi:hypothetical protein